MKLNDISLNNFRRYEKGQFRFHPQFTVLIGDNGKGKTTVLDAIAIMLGTYFQGSKIITGQSVIRKQDARFVVRDKGGQTFFEPQPDVTLSATAEIHQKPIYWCREKGDRGGKAKDFIDIGVEDRNNIGKGENVELPLLLYYGAKRLWDIHRNVQTEKPGSQLDAYRFCLDPKSDQKSFEKWFKRLSYSEIQKNQSIPAVTAVKQAIKTCIPNALEFYYDLAEDQILIRLQEEGLIPFNNLSDGYRNMLAMVADIAHRACRLNPHLEGEAPTKTLGVVLIDEIDLHLHPKWQRHVVNDLQKAFPAIQFIATTHSPFILQSLDSGEVIDLSQSSLLVNIEQMPENMAAPAPENRYSNTSIEDITERVMGIELPQRSWRYKKMNEAAKRYYHILQQANKTPPAKKEELKEKLDELSAPYTDNIAYHAFLEMKRLASGIDISNEEEHT